MAGVLPPREPFERRMRFKSSRRARPDLFSARI